jgi:hypothetical protein
MSAFADGASFLADCLTAEQTELVPAGRNML